MTECQVMNLSREFKPGGSDYESLNRVSYIEMIMPIHFVRFLFLLTSIAFIHVASAQQLSSQASIAVVTIGPYQGELYSAFGHSGLRVFDPSLGMDYFYNYGVFDFDQPNFYLNFAKGKNRYRLDVDYYPPWRDAYIRQNRYVHEQVLNLTPGEAQKLFQFLNENAKPENRYYYYDYFYDNCSNRIRDVLQEVFREKVVFDGSYIKERRSIRDLTDLYLTHQPWGDLGIDLCLGLPMDKMASPWEYMFLPDYLEYGFDHARIKRNDEVIPLVKDKIMVYTPHPEDLPSGFPHPLLIFSIIPIIAIGICLYDLKVKRISKAFDILLFSLSGLIGLLLVVLWFFTDHKAAAYNMNVLWALPSHLVAVVALFKKRRWLRHYFLVVACIQAVLLIFWFVLPQELHYSLIPVVFALLIRSAFRYFMSNREVSSPTS